jgi:predicted amidohydrolase YtcJ
MLLRNARVSGGPGEPVDVRVENGVITQIGALGGSGDEARDLGGRWLSPGLWDNHVHFSQWALVQQRLDVSTAGSAREAVAMVVGELQSADSDPGSTLPFIGYGFRDGLWRDEPTVEALDAVGGRRPIVLVSGDLHSVWLNSVALALYGHAGATGLLVEEPAFEITRRLGIVADELLDLWVDAAARRAASRGVVGIVDLEMAWSLDAWTRRIASGTRSLRVEFGVYAQHLDRAIALGLRTGDRVNDRLTVGPLKLISDGSLNTRTAYCFDEYPGREGAEHSHGLLTLPPEELLPLMRRGAAAGIVPTVHAIGDHANAIALDAFAELGVVASVQPDHALDDRDVAEHHWAGRTGRAFALRGLLDSGATLALGSDAPVSPLDPWVTIAAAVSRSRGDREPWHPEQRISTAEALSASTRTTVAVGQPADLIATDIDPLTAPVEGLRHQVVAATLLGGEFTHDTL